MIVEFLSRPEVNAILTVAQNALWMGVLSFGWSVLYRYGQLGSNPRMMRSIYWAGGASLCYLLHRVWWNSGIIADSDHSSGPSYASWATEYKHGLIVLLMGAAFFVWRALLELLPPELHARYTQHLAGHIGGWMAVWFTLLYLYW